MKRKIVNLFVHKISLALHWSRLRQVFGRQGDIVDQFTAGKLDRAVSIEKYGGRTSYWRKLNLVSARGSPPKRVKPLTLDPSSSKAPVKLVGETSSESLDSLNKPRLKRIIGFIEDEALRKLNKCLIGTMKTVCNTSQVVDRLQAWGLNGITVEHLGDCKFLIDISDQELFSHIHVHE
ncbi:hypothetical protein GQ457_11G023060 [Hibiscus cannabinus]